MSITLIANSGIQFSRFDLIINPDDENSANDIGSMGFREIEVLKEYSLEYAYRIKKYNIWVSKEDLVLEGYLDENNKLKNNININVLESQKIPDTNRFTISDIADCMDIFASDEDENIWIPIPYFKRNTSSKSIFGPISWARMILKRKTSKNKKTQEYKVILAFDTKIDEKSKYDLSKEITVFNTPQYSQTNENDNVFTLCNNEDENLHFCDEKYYCGWVNDYLKKIYENYLVKEGYQKSKIDEFPRLKYIGYYLYLIKYLEATGQFPEIKFYSEKAMSPIDVDLVIDIGNSNTCGILFESPLGNNFEFNSAKKLKLTDLSNPEYEYDDPFSMRLAFVEPKFGTIHDPNYKSFRWPSLLRLGKEAARFITKYSFDDDKESETATHHSSPKRYLWDSNKAKIQWEVINLENNNPNKSIYYEGLSEQFTDKGEYISEISEDDITLPYYSRKSLMTFVYIEILLHAITQINSYEFRSAHGTSERPRKLRRITITCPTSIIQQEQVVLREAASVAAKSLQKFYSGSFLAQEDEDDLEQKGLEIVPSPEDLSIPLSEIKDREDWVYDEATSGQLVYLYAEISKRYQNKANVFFNLYGKKRDDVINKEEKAITIGSIDIGGGTTDLMICAYQNDNKQSGASIKPQPLFWESFNLAGDDLLKRIIQEIILEGKPENIDDKDCTGVIQNNAEQKGIIDIAERMNGFFGSNTNKQEYRTRIFRKNFIVQVAIPIGLRYLEHAIKNQPDIIVSYNEIFSDLKPNQALIDFFNNHFAPLKFEDIKWKLSKEKVFKVVDKTFTILFKHLSAILSAYGCDIVLLTGKPTTIPKIREMFIQYYPVPPERIISLNSYRVGRWYPFADEIGYFEDPKTIVAVGALIGLMGDTKVGKLNKFTIDTSLLIRNLLPTSDYIGLLGQDQKIENILLSPFNKKEKINIKSFPVILGYKQLPNKQYLARPIYKIDYNEYAIREDIKKRLGLDEQDDKVRIDNAVKNEIKMLKQGAPYNITLRKEEDIITEPTIEMRNIKIEEIKDSDKNDIDDTVISLSIMTLPDEEGYWLDTGIFQLNIGKDEITK